MGTALHELGSIFRGDIIVNTLYGCHLAGMSVRVEELLEKVRKVNARRMK